MSFDDIQPGTNITDQAFNVAGTTVTFKTWTYNSVASGVSATSDLIVVDAASTVTPPVGFSYFGGSTTVDTSPWKLHATSGDNILSPGGPELRAGPNPQYETDGIEIDFDPPVKAVGMDFLFQSLDCCLFTSVATFDASGQQILTGGLPGNGGPGGSPSGNVFYGIVSGTANIARIRVAETDGSGDFPDTNLAYDSLRLVPGAPAVTCGAAGSSATTAPTPPSGLVARWLADGNANDAVGTHNGAPQNGAGYAIGRSGQAFCFDGTDDFFQMPDSDDWAFGTGDFTVSTWVNFDTAPGGTVVHPDAIFVANDEGAGWTNKWFFSLGGGMLYFGASNPSGPAGVPGDYYAQTPFTPTPGTWYHVAARRANGTFTTFVNGTAGTSQFACGAMPNPNAPLTMGLTEGLGHFDGRMDDVQIYRRALTEAELQTLAGQPATGSTTLPAAQTCPGDPPGGGGGSGSPIELTKDGPATANVGEQLTYRIRTKNNATTPATNVHVIDQVPAGLHIVSITPDPGMTCTGLNVNPVVCTIPVLQPQEIKQVLIVVEATVPGPVHNEATATWDGGPSGGVHSNPVDTGVGGRRGVWPQKGVRILTGPKLEYTIDVENFGPDDVTNVVAKDILDPRLALVSLTKPNDVSCDTQVVCNIPLLQVGEKRTIVFVVSLTGIGPIDNTVEVTWGGGGAPHTWTAHGDPFPDLRVSKAHGNLVAGRDADYTITVSNIGSGPTTAPITVVDTLPAGLTYKSSTGGGFTCSPNGGTVTCTRTDPLAPQTQASFTMTVAVAPDAPVELINRVVITGGDGFPHDPVSDGGPVTRPPALTGHKRPSARTVTVGHNLTYFVDVTNTGGMPATNVKIIDIVPAGETLFAVRPEAPLTCTTSGNTVTCDAGTLAPNEMRSVEIEVRPTTITTFDNKVTLIGDGLPPVEVDGGPVDVVKAPGLGITKEAPPVVTRNSTLQYTITVKNLGPGDAADVKINDPLPTGVALVSVNPDPTFGMTCNLSAPPEIPNLQQPVVCTVPLLPELKVTRVVLVVRVTTVGTIGNTASADSGEPSTGGGRDGNTVTDSTTTTSSDPVPSAVNLGDRVWNDVDADGVQDTGEVGINGVLMELLDDTGAVVSTTVTAGDGNYAFEVHPGKTYTVRVAASNAASGGPLAGWTQTYPTGGIWTVKPTGQGITDADFGFRKPGVKLGDRVWNDADGDGVQDSGEAGINGVTVELLQGSTVLKTAVTAGDGTYSFTVDPGTYTVRIAASNLTGSGPLAGSTRTFPAAAAEQTRTVSTTDVLDADFGYRGNRPPVAKDDTYVTPAGTTLTVPLPGILGNDTDQDGGPMTAVIVSQPGQGTLTPKPDGSFQYTPPAGFTGQVTFTYKANDGTSDSNVATVTIIAYGAPAVGQFVIGDRSSHATGQTVTFWGGQWDQNNPMSGGPASNSFKGYDSDSANPRCGGTWTSRPGDSSQPPSTVPAYLAVIVASHVDKSGSDIAGDIKEIVIVKTNPGYDANPGHAGSAVVVAKLCG